MIWSLRLPHEVEHTVESLRCVAATEVEYYG